MKKIYFAFSLVVLIFAGCKSNSDLKTEKVLKHHRNIIKVSESIKDIHPKILFGKSFLYIIDDVLIVNEISPKGEKGIHLFNKDTFEYLTSTGIIGNGPGEINTPGRLGIDRVNRVFWAPDHGKQVLYKFPLDSVLNNSGFMPTIKKKLNNELFINEFDFLNDSIALGKAIHVINTSSVNSAMAMFNVNSNVIKKFGYENPKASGKKASSFFVLSVKNKIYVNLYYYCDLMTICDLEGNLKCNVYGPEWNDNKKDKNNYFFGADVIKKQIIASYIGGPGVITKGNISQGALPTKFLVFDIEGNYLKTIETGSEVFSFCVDEDNSRIIAYFDDREEQLGYFDIGSDI
jgi:hypothetical protein